MGRSTVDQNYKPTIIGVDHIGFNIPTEVAVDSTTHELLVKTNVLLPTAGNNASLTISNVDTAVASTTVITKTIGSTSYTKTISKNAAGDVVSVSAWS